MPKPLTRAQLQAIIDERDAEILASHQVAARAMERADKAENIDIEGLVVATCTGALAKLVVVQPPQGGGGGGYAATTHVAQIDSRRVRRVLLFLADRFGVQLVDPPAPEPRPIELDVERLAQAAGAAVVDAVRWQIPEVR